MVKFRVLALALLALALATPATAEQQYDPGGKARVSEYCTTTYPGDTACPPSASATTRQGPPALASFTNKSLAITLGGTSQTLIAVNASRKRIIIQNRCTATSQGIVTAESIFINFTSAASGTDTSSFEIPPCGSYDSEGGPVSTEAVTVVAATTGHIVIAKEQ